MKNKRQQSKLRAFISNLMKGKTEEEITSAEEAFSAYIEIARKIHQRVQSENTQILDDLYGSNNNGVVLYD
ncbi:hypothetical protein N9954_08875 [Maribacter sp.]|nr:hypothetical protein [Maribacter sp.]